ncbi:MAG TPA: oligosaccharide flippase family protein [Thermoanaerobaculia bacterium]|nr:oligosaccharide flippase family protein [Thermoanaerobaculia bacterium]
MSAAAGHTTEQRLLRSTYAAYAIQFARLAVGFGAKIILARLIIPDGHGLYELALRIVTVASAVRDLGLPYHLVRDNRRPYGTVLASTTFLGIVITLVLIAAAPVFGGLNPDLPLVLRVFAAWVILDGLSVVPKAFFERELTIGRLVGPEIARGFVIAIVSVLLAWLGWGVWSFVAADLAAALLYGVWSWARAWGKVPLHVDLSLLPDLIRRSSYLFWIWIVIQLVTYIDAFIIQIFEDTKSVGLYARTYMLVFLVPTIVYPRALFPTLVEYLDDRPRFLEVFRLSAIQLLGCQVIASYFLFLNAHRVILIFGEEWLPAVPILQALAFIPFFDQFSMMGGEMMKARHEDRAWLIIMVVNLISLVGFGIFLTGRFGAPGMAAANYLLVGNLLMAWRVKEMFGPRFRQLLGDFALLYLIPLPFFALAAWLFPPESWTRFSASILAAALAAGALVLRYQRPFREFFGRR